MILHPTLVIGVGSTGKFIVNNAEKYLYEVLNGESLKLFKFIVFETAINQQDQALSSSGTHTEPIDIKVKDIGASCYTLQQNLHDEFNWCPSMTITGPGAGNKRAGGRLMMFQHMVRMTSIVQRALNDVSQAAMDPATSTHVNALLRQRGGREQQQFLPRNPVPVVTVVGTLAGGTCSGTCVDLGYLLRRIAPNSHREAVFTLPDQGSIGTYKANTWAALSDLVYFTEHPGDYKAAWLTEAVAREAYSEGTQVSAEPPYNKIYLVSQRDRRGNAQLPYSDDASSPLLMMNGLFIAANILGLHELRHTRLVDLNTRVDSMVHNTFLTQSLRGVSYPKYEISEAAACRIMADDICQNWLSNEACYVQGRREELQKEEINKRGRELWNAKCPSIWEGLRGNVDLRGLAEKIKAGKITDVRKFMKEQIIEDREDRIYRSIHQNVENRRRELQHAIRLGLVEVLQQKQNLQYAEWFLDGVQSELERSRRYWQSLGTPVGDNDIPAWQARADALANRLVSRYTGVSVNMLGERLDVIEDELDQIVCRLEMFLMYRTVGETALWIDTELRARCCTTVRGLLVNLRTFASGRAEAIGNGLADRSGPLLKLSRSPDRGFTQEIAELSKAAPAIPGKDFVDYAGSTFKGLWFVSARSGQSVQESIFQELIDRIQPTLIQQLQQGGAIDIVAEIERQQVKPQAIQRAHATQALSLPTRHELMVGRDNVPSLLLTKSAEASQRLDASLRQADPALPVLKDEELPLFDHMAMFYQEGGKFTMDSLLYADDLKRAFEDARHADEAVVDPLRLLKTASSSASVTPIAAGEVDGRLLPGRKESA